MTDAATQRRIDAALAKERAWRRDPNAPEPTEADWQRIEAASPNPDYREAKRERDRQRRQRGRAMPSATGEPPTAFLSAYR